MVQMCSGLLPEPNLEQGTKLIRQAVADGADYVQTPEVSNMIQANRKALFEHLASEEDDLSLKAYRALAAGTENPSPYRLAGAALLAREGRQPLVPDRARRHGARELRQDPHVRHRPARRRKLSRIRQLPAGRDRRDLRPALGPHRSHHLLRHALSGAVPGAGRKRRLVPDRAVRLHGADRRGALAYAAARPRHRKRLFRLCRGAGRHA